MEIVYNTVYTTSKQRPTMIRYCFCLLPGCLLIIGFTVLQHHSNLEQQFWLFQKQLLHVEENIVIFKNGKYVQVYTFRVFVYEHSLVIPIQTRSRINIRTCVCANQSATTLDTYQLLVLLVGADQPPTVVKSLKFRLAKLVCGDLSRTIYSPQRTT